MDISLIFPNICSLELIKSFTELIEKIQSNKYIHSFIYLICIVEKLLGAGHSIVNKICPLTLGVSAGISRQHST